MIVKSKLLKQISNNYPNFLKKDLEKFFNIFLDEIKNSLKRGERVDLRGFGSFIVKKRAEKTGRNIKNNTTLKIPAHNIPAFKPSKFFVEGVKTKVKID